MVVSFCGCMGQQCLLNIDGSEPEIVANQKELQANHGYKAEQELLATNTGLRIKTAQKATLVANQHWSHTCKTEKTTMIVNPHR